ncbi:non-ribosomal peptide synthetase, partial [Ruminiclostridium cellobioparum]|uniref:non-ribosomal peptide synthetase n=1 Tax=Ruminiclostridium cellobioparum TaxID=29355 RepID=UPI0028AF3CED
MKTDRYFENIIVSSGKFKDSKEYWTKRLEGDITFESFISMSGNSVSDKKRQILYELPREIYQKLFNIADKSELGLFIMLTSGVKFLLYKYSNNNDISIGMPQFKENEQEISKNNVLCLRTVINSSETVREYLYKVRETVIEAKKHSNIPFGKIAEIVGLNIGEDRIPKYNTLVCMENIHNAGYLNKVEAGVVFYFKIEEGSLKITIEYNGNVYEEQTIYRIYRQLVKFLAIIAENSNIRLSDIYILSEEEKHEVLDRLNQTDAEYPKEKLIYEIFEEKVSEIPTSTAVVDGNRELTYSELNKKANSLARLLRKNGVKKDTVVGIMAHQSIEFVIGVLGVLKAGGAYLPIDVAYPADRIKYMLEDSNARILLVDGGQLVESGCEKVTTVIDLRDESLYSGDGSNLRSHTDPYSLAYIIYTSGSTGQPKGVMVTHLGLMNYVYWANKVYVGGESMDFPLYSSISFDLTVTSIYTPLISGNRIIVYNSEDKVLVVARIFEECRVGIVKLTPTHLRLLEGVNLSKSGIKKIIVGGEDLKTELAKSIHEASQGRIEIFNEYGPTEAVVGCMIYKYNYEKDIRQSVPIGVPADNTQIYLLDKDMKPVPTLAEGEIYISGDGVARGYINKPELTRERFLNSPFIHGKIMYKTGDLARRLPDGNIEFVGRKDGQVKIRGYRIELGEIESALLKYEDIREVIVEAREAPDERGPRYLCAYLVSDKKTQYKDIRRYLLDIFPEYMVPEYFVTIDSMPLTSNGKLDRKALPDPLKIYNQESIYEGPNNEIEEKISVIWQEILGVEQIGINENFFEMGGNSLKVSAMLAKLHKQLNIVIPLKEMFRLPTIKGLAQIIEDSGEKIFASIEPAQEKEFYPLSSVQKRMFIFNHYESNNISYNIPVVMIVEGELDKNRFEDAVEKLVQRHDALRTAFMLLNEEPVQKVYAEVDLNIKYIEIPEDKVDSLVKGFIQPFDLSKAPLLRISLARISDTKHILMFDMHHIIADGSSMEILIKEFTTLYEGGELPPLRIQYKDFACWQKLMVTSEAVCGQKRYWEDIFRGEIPVLNLPLDYQRATVQSFEGNSLSFSVGKTITESLKRIALETGATLYMVLLAAYNILLAKYSDVEDIVVGAPVAGRNHTDLENIMGMFVNTLAIRSRPERGKTFVEFLMDTKENVIASFENADYPFEELIENINLSRSAGRNPLFDTLFVLQNIGISEICIDKLRFIPFDFHNGISKFDISLTAFEEDEDIKFSFEYCTKLFKQETIDRMSKHFVNILQDITDNPSKRLMEINMLSEEEKEKIILDFNNTETHYPVHSTINLMFEEQAGKTPNNVAVIFRDGHMTYRELNEKANRLASALRGKGTGAGSIIGILAERSFEMLVGIMGILKSGAAYMPLSPEYPEERIRYMLEDSSAKILLAQERFVDELVFDGDVLNLDNEGLYEGDGSNPEIINKPDDLAYVLYTSGSTGRPKGVMIEHRSIINRLHWMQRKYPLGEGDAILQKTPYSFDVSVWELLGWSFAGARVCLLEPGEEKDPAAIIEAVEKNRITTIHFVPSMLNIFLNYVEELESVDRLKSLKQVFVGGEALSVRQVNTFNRMIYEGNGTKLHNLYGPTEAAVDVSSFDCPTSGELETVPIGRPIDNIRLYILNKDNRLQPVGVPGELCISGVGVGRGYLNREELTKEKFVEDPFKPGEKMYRTGDLAKWMPDGNIEYLGRMDNQVKIRGYRIELGEIEAQLLKQESIKEAIVVVREDEKGDKLLCSYVVSDIALELNEIRKSMKEELPDYMVPTFITQLLSIPLTHSGKVDRKALPEPLKELSLENEFEGAANEIEEELLKIWMEVLDLDQIGVNDNFFELGGQSLKAVVLLAKIHKKFDTRITVKEMFTVPTIKELARIVMGAKKNIYAAIEPVDERDYYPVSSAQKRMYILSQFKEVGTSYNVHAAIIIEGCLERERLEQAVNTLVERHEALRTSFEVYDEEIVQRIHKEVYFEIIYKKADESELNGIIKEFIQPFELSKAPLLRVCLVTLSENRHALIYDMPHIITDGTSMFTLVKEFVELYQCRELPELKLQYKDYSNWQRKQEDSEAFKNIEKYWIDLFSGEVPVLMLPTDYARSTMSSFEGDTLSLILDKNITADINRFIADTGVTLHILLLSVFNVLLAKYTSQYDIVVGTAVAGRPHADLQNIIGMFVNMLSMRNYPEQEKTFYEFLAEVKANSIKAYENQDYQFEMLVDKLNLKRNTSRNPLYDVMCTVQNVEIPEIEIDELKFKPYSYDNKITHADINLMVKEVNGETVLHFEYCTGLFKRETIEKIACNFKNIVVDVLDNPQKKLIDINMISQEEKLKILFDFNDTETVYPYYKMLHGLFTEQALRTPKNVAVQCDNFTITYRELEQRSNQLARILRKKGVGPNCIVGILLDNSPETIMSMLGVLKAGGAYLPIDISYPDSRVSYVLNDSQPIVILTTNEAARNCCIEKEKSFSGEIIYVDRLLSEKMYEDDTTLENINKPDDLAYIIYTSGSTGKPKGVMVTHLGLINYIYWADKVYVKGEKLDFPLYSSISFDLTVTSIYTPLVSGNRIVIYKGEDRVQLVRRIVEEGKVGIIKLTPTHLRLLEEVDLGQTAVKKLIVGGEDLKTELARKIHESSMGEIEIYNEYGPTEAVVGCMIYKYDYEKDRRGSVPIGKPADNVQIYLLDKDMNPVTDMVEGEMYISGDGVARGYLNRPELTKERFLNNPFISVQKMYKTGDLARRLSDGNIEYIGRLDSQVKIRGYRIEPGEVENALLNYEPVKNAAVIVREDNSEKYLAAYIVSESQLSISKVREHLIKEIPDYMVPSQIVQVDTIPLTLNGKVDVDVLIKKENKIERGKKYEREISETESVILNIWKELLSVENIQINDDFFEYGGHSLKATILVNRLYKEFNVKVPLGVVFEKSTISELAEYIESVCKEEYVSITPVEKREFYPLSSAQKRMFLVSQFRDIGTSYNTPAIVLIEGDLDVKRFEKAVRAFLQRHEILRTSFEFVEDVAVQKIHDAVDFEVSYIEIEERLLDSVINEFIKPFNLDRAPLFRVCLAQMGEKRNAVLFDMHHIVTDGISLGVLVKEFSSLYEDRILNPLTIQYKDFAVWQNNLLKSINIKKQEEYWLNIFKDNIPVLNFPTDYSRPSIQSFNGDSASITLDKNISLELRKLAFEADCTNHIVLLAVLDIVLSKYSDQEDIVVATAVAGRRHPELENIVGVFINMLCMRNYPVSSKTFMDFLSEVRGNSIKAYENQDYQFEMMVEKVGGRKGLDRNPIYDVSLTTQNVDIPVLYHKDLVFKPYNFINKVTHSDLNFTVNDQKDEIILNLEYCSDLFTKKTIQNLLSHFKNGLEYVLKRPYAKLSEISILSENEKRNIVYGFNNTESPYPMNKKIYQLFEEQVDRTLDNIAIESDDRCLTYKEL